MTDGLRPGITAPLRLYLVPDTALHFIKAQTEQRLSTVEVQKVMEAIDCNNEARYLVTVRHANADRCFTDHEKKT